MTKRRFERYQYRHILTRMRQGDSDLEIARSKTMGRKKIAQVRELASARGWLAPDTALPDDTVLASALVRKESLPSTCISTLEPWRAQIGTWYAAGIQGTTIHATLVRNHGYTGSCSAVCRFLHRLVVDEVAEVALRLDFKPGEAVQVDFGAGPPITDVHTGEIFKTWFFVMTLAWSRHQYAECVRDQTVATWLGCHRRAFEWFGGVVERVTIDNAKCANTRACVYEPEKPDFRHSGARLQPPHCRGLPLGEETPSGLGAPSHWFLRALGRHSGQQIYSWVLRSIVPSHSGASCPPFRLIVPSLRD